MHFTNQIENQQSISKSLYSQEKNCKNGEKLPIFLSKTHLNLIIVPALLRYSENSSSNKKKP